MKGNTEDDRRFRDAPIDVAAIADRRAPPAATAEVRRRRGIETGVGRLSGGGGGGGARRRGRRRTGCSRRACRHRSLSSCSPSAVLLAGA